MKFNINKQTQYAWFNKLISHETYGSGISVIITYSTVIIDRLSKKADTSFVKGSTFYIAVKVSSEEFSRTYSSSNDRVLYAAEAKCNHVIGFGIDQIHFTSKDVVGSVVVNDNNYFFIELDK